MSKALDSPAMSAKAATTQEVIGQAAMGVLGLPNGPAWTQIITVLSIDPACSPSMQHELRPLVWKTRKRLARHAAANPGLTEEALRQVATEIAAEVVAGVLSASRAAREVV